MPLIFRNRTPSLISLSSSTSSSSTTSSAGHHDDPAQPTDADDSIVLSDLVRTGEASRLRRRGAIAINRESNRVRAGRGGRQRAQREASWGAPPGHWSEWASNGWVEAGEASGSGNGAGNWTTWDEPDKDDEEDREDDSTLGYFNLFCGAPEIPSSWSSKPFEPSILPIHPPSQSTSKSALSQPQKTNGCGTLLTTQATPSPRRQVWNAHVVSSPCPIVPLDAEFFKHSEMKANVFTARCGCRRVGIGCSICGNPLGMVCKPCPVAAEGFISPYCLPQCHPRRQPIRSRTRTRPPTPRRTSSGGSPSRGGTRARSQSHDRERGAQGVFIFFGTAVSFSPSSTPVPQNQKQQRRHAASTSIHRTSSPSSYPSHSPIPIPHPPSPPSAPHMSPPPLSLPHPLRTSNIYSNSNSRPSSPTYFHEPLRRHTITPPILIRSTSPPSPTLPPPLPSPALPPLPSSPPPSLPPPPTPPLPLQPETPRPRPWNRPSPGWRSIRLAVVEPSGQSNEELMEREGDPVLSRVFTASPMPIEAEASVERTRDEEETGEGRHVDPFENDWEHAEGWPRGEEVGWGDVEEGGWGRGEENGWGGGEEGGWMGWAAGLGHERLAVGTRLDLDGEELVLPGSPDKSWDAGFMAER